jgi:transcriptional regulator with XRE-family HTH domain
VTPALISAYEKLERKPSIDKLVALADIFHVSTDYILGRTFKDDSAAVLSVDGLSEKQIRIVRELIYELRSNGKTEF